MSRDEQDNQAFDQAMRRLHAQAVGQVSPATRARVRVARQAATASAGSRAPGRGMGWALASGFAAVFALVIGLQLRPAPQTPAVAVAPSSQSAATGYDADTAVAVLDENPDLYLWLASNDDAVPTAEQ